MTTGLAGYRSPGMITDPATRDSLHGYIATVLDALSTPGSDVASYFTDPDVAISGSGLDEFFMGPAEAQQGTSWVSTLGLRWDPRTIVSWQRGEIAWAQVRMEVHKKEGDAVVLVPYVMTGVFARTADGWSWLYWGGAEPQAEPRV